MSGSSCFQSKQDSDWIRFDRLIAELLQEYECSFRRWMLIQQQMVAEIDAATAQRLHADDKVEALKSEVRRWMERCSADRDMRADLIAQIQRERESRQAMQQAFNSKLAEYSDYVEKLRGALGERSSELMSKAPAIVEPRRFSLREMLRI